MEAEHLLILLFPALRGWFITITNYLNFEDMKEFFEMMEKDYMSEGFSKREWVIYGIIAPVVLVIGCVIADGIARL